MSAPSTACPQCALEFSGGEIFCPVDGARLVTVARSSGLGSGDGDPLIGQTLAGRYHIVRKIGEGGMGIVYEAMHVVIEKRVALKVLREDFSHRPDVVERFRQEAKSASRIGHEHIIDISDFGVTAQGAHFFVMELLSGRDLAEELELRGCLPVRRAIEIVLQCTRALGAAHAKGIVHRDMKPENVFLVQRATGDDYVKIVDFGIAKMSDIETGGPGKKLTKTGMIFGTPEYMSPEQAGGKELDHRVDVYALGVILYELVAGRVPFVGDTFMGILTQHVLEQVPPLSSVNPRCSAPPELEQIIRKAMAKTPGERQRSMEELGAELASLLQRLSITSSVPPPGTITHVDRSPLATAQTAFAESGPPALRRTEDYDYDAPRTASRAPLWGALVGLLVLGAGGLYYALRSDGSAPLAREAPTAIAAQAAPVEQVAAVPVPVEPEPSSAPEAPPSNDVAIDVITQPDGASVLVDGRTMCAPTPCRFEAPRGSELKLAAQKSGFRSGSAELTATHDVNQVDIVLRPRERRGGVRMEGELMLPDAFGKR